MKPDRRSYATSSDPGKRADKITGAMDRLRRFLDIRPGEGWPVFLTFLYIANVIASLLLAKPIRTGLFLNSFGAANLIYVYVTVPLVLSLFVPAYAWVAARTGQRRVITLTLVFFSLNVIAFWYLFRFHSIEGLPFAFFIWVNCYAVIAPVQVWTFANSVFDTRQAKRLFGVIGGGASLGAILGGYLARTLVVPVGGPVNLMLVLAAMIGCAAILVNVAWHVVPRRSTARPAGRRARVPFLQTLRTIRGTPYLLLIVTIVFLVEIVTQWTQFMFSVTAEQQFARDAMRLTQFFGGFSFYLGLVAFTVQLLLTGTALRKLGIGFTILLLPVALASGCSLILLFPVLWTVALTNAFDQGIRFSIDKATYELLYLPIPPTMKTSVKIAIDTVVNRVAAGVGGVLLGLATKGFNLVLFRIPGAGFELRGVSTLCLVVIGVWIAVALAARRGYIAAISDSIQQHRLDTERAAAARVFDRAATQAIASKLGANDPGEILYALGLLQAQGVKAVHPAVRGLLDHPSAAVRRAALGILAAAGDRGAAPRVEKLLQDSDPEVRTEALLYLAYHGGLDPLAHIAELGDFADYSVRAATAAFLARPGRMQNLEAARLIVDAMTREPDPDGHRVRLEAARIVAAQPDAFEPQIHLLLADPDADVARHALEAVGRSRNPAFVEAALARLGDPGVTQEAADALGRFGDDLVDLLGERLFDPAAPLDVRREIPPVLVRIGTPAAQRTLMEALLESDTTLRLRIISSLNKLRQVQPALTLDEQAVEMVLGAEIIGHYRSYQILGTLGGSFEADDPLVAGLRQSMDEDVERIFRLMGLLFPNYDLHSAWFGLRSSSGTVRANALEFLDNVLRPELRNLIVPILDSQVTIGERVALANRVVGTAVTSREEAVEAMARSDDPWLKACAAYAIGTLRMHELAGELRRWLDDPDPLLRETARAAGVRLHEPDAVADTDDTETSAATMGVG
jgi:AAA family ATP:ADP antiporter